MPFARQFDSQMTACIIKLSFRDSQVCICILFNKSVIKFTPSELRRAKLLAMSQPAEDPAVTRFREYLRCPSGHPNPSYAECIHWLRDQAAEIRLDYNYYDLPEPGLFVLWMTWKGSDPELKSVLLNSHIDVVPVELEKWNTDPFGAVKDSDGNIYARGAQDMKCVGVQYLEAIRRLRAKGVVPLRTVHVLFVPDEEIGGFHGMQAFVKSDAFKTLNVGFALDEGIASPDETYTMFYGERVGVVFEIKARGTTGHASAIPDGAGTAVVKLSTVVNRLLDMREEQRVRLESDPKLELGDVDTINLTRLGGGLAENIIPSELWAKFTMRLSSGWTRADALRLLQDMCTEAGPGVELLSPYLLDNEYNHITPITHLTPDNIWWTTFKSTCDRLGIRLNTKIFPAATDSRYLRQIGIPAFGFSPMNNTPILLHDHNELLNERVFLRGIEIYEEVLPDIVNISRDG